ncbi:hypothetical protein HELRODRAFT_156422 [Helobdella robusta]|uniref:RING-type domain-containing protein n=1 Tax=Helobdella robusta TaxID=6412 RepID=T1ELW1_HELRO|nr:hypothetical protein HELRODRAFT_156422 [Helobdella robusta]ESO09257.1 hypothetical protein HELRODRAFT_156422 [Helobdella robusta]
MSSTLVETVSINYEDFSDSFLTCGTCLSVYNNEERTPKLLCCSHTVCLSCLEHIVAAQGENSTNFRCPICRETIPIPRGGVNSFPPSFIVNQLLDLMGRQRRDVIPKCSRHPQSELMFCETCDVVFCTDCTEGSHSIGGASAHTVIPFSIAIKRMSEILLYKAGLCIKNLDDARDVVSQEIERLDAAHDKCVDSISKAFQNIADMVESRKQEVLKLTKKVRDEKKKSLLEQLDLIQSEKCKVQNNCQGLQHQVDVRNITSKIGDLNEKLDISATLMEPRENAFMHFDYQHNSSSNSLKTSLNQFGRISVSKTFPALCSASIEKNASIRLNYNISISTVDYHGNIRTSGGDPVEIKLIDPKGKITHADVDDNEDGTYSSNYSFIISGPHKLHIYIFNRPIKDSPFSINVSEHIDPVVRFGSPGSGFSHFKQPVAIFITGDQFIYILDTGNSRIKITDKNLSAVEGIITGRGLEQHSATGMCLLQSLSYVVIANWRTKQITILGLDGTFICQFTNEHFVEPISVAATSRDEIVVADNGLGKIFVFDCNGKLLQSFGCKGSQPGQFKLITSIYVVPSSNDIIVCDNRLQVFTNSGLYKHELSGDTSSKGSFGGVCFDGLGKFLATKLEKGRCVIQVFDALSHNFLYEIDSFNDKLKRPCGLTVSSDGFVYVVDLGNDCVKKYRYV